MNLCCQVNPYLLCTICGDKFCNRCWADRPKDSHPQVTSEMHFACCGKEVVAQGFQPMTFVTVSSLPLTLRRWLDRLTGKL